MIEKNKPKKNEEEKVSSEKHGISLRKVNIGILTFAILLSIALFFRSAEPTPSIQISTVSPKP